MSELSSTSKRGRIAVIVVVLAVVVAAVALAVVRMNRLPADAAFRYGDRTVTIKELDDRIDVLRALYGVQRPEQKSKLDQFKRDAAKSMVISLVLADEARRRDIVIADKRAQTQLDRMVDQQLMGGHDAFIEFLSTEGVSERDVLDEVRSQLATTELMDDVFADVPKATVAQARQTYDSRKDEMVTPEGRTLVNIVVESREDAARVARLAQESGQLGPLAAAWSLDGSTRDKGGALGTLTKSQLEEPYAKAAFGADKGAIFGPVKTKSGWNVGQVMDIVPPRAVTFEDVKNDLIKRLTAKYQLTEWRSFLHTSLKNADVEYADAYRPADPTSAPEDAASSSAKASSASGG